ncbi:MAG TPA: HTTM domain-containing protein [Haliangium sp.]|nr:HTTM domain-containing protein [Haliangium sp.]
MKTPALEDASSTRPAPGAGASDDAPSSAAAEDAGEETGRRRGPLRRAVAAVHGFFTIELDPFVLGVFRIALAAYLLLYYVMLAPSWLLYYGPDGISPHVGMGPRDYYLLHPIIWYVKSHAVMWLLYGAAILSVFLLASGVLWRLAAVWLWYMNLTLLYGNPYVVNGEEQVLALLLLFSLFMPLGVALSVRVRRPRRPPETPPAKVRVWPLRALQIHLMLVYLLSLPDKFTTGPAWHDGTLVYYALMAVDYTRWPGIEVVSWANAALSRVLTYFSVAVEIVVPVFIWFRKLRLLCTLLAMSLHLGMGFLLEGVAMFNGAMLVGMVLFLPSRCTREWLTARLARLRGARSPAASAADLL